MSYESIARELRAEEQRDPKTRTIEGWLRILARAAPTRYRVLAFNEPRGEWESKVPVFQFFGATDRLLILGSTYDIGDRVFARGSATIHRLADINVVHLAGVLGQQGHRGEGGDSVPEIERLSLASASASGPSVWLNALGPGDERDFTVGTEGLAALLATVQASMQP